MALRTPLTLSAEQRQAQLREAGRAPAPEAEAPKLTPEEIRLRLQGPAPAPSAPAEPRRSLLMPRQPVVNASADMRPGDDFDGASMTLHPDQIDSYDRNPRKTRNPRYDEIKQSMLVQGILSPLTVTRRGPGQRYFVYSGGNTRLEIAKEIVREDPNHPLSKLTVTYRAWKSESDCLVAHLVENELREDNTWWEKAQGYADYKAEVERQAGDGISLQAAELRRRAHQDGLKLHKATAGLYLFTVEHLRPLGPWLRHASTDSLAKCHAQLTDLFGRVEPLDGRERLAVLFEEAVEERAAIMRRAAEDSPLLEGDAPEVDAESLIRSIRDRAAGALKCSSAELQRMLALLATQPQTSADQLREAARTVGQAATDASAPTAANEAPVAPTPVQRLLPTPMLAGVPPPPTAGPVDPVAEEPLSAEAMADLQRFPSLAQQGDLPEALRAEARDVAGTAAAPAAPREPARNVRQQLLDTIVQLAQLCMVQDLIVPARHLPLGYLMDLPAEPGGFGPNPQSNLPPAQQITLRRGGWQLLALISVQLDARFQNGAALQALPSSRWRDAVEGGALNPALQRCGVLDGPDGPSLDAGALFYLLTEPSRLGPGVRRLMSALQACQAEQADLLPRLLKLSLP